MGFTPWGGGVPLSQFFWSDLLGGVLLHSNGGLEAALIPYLLLVLAPRPGAPSTGFAGYSPELDGGRITYSYGRPSRRLGSSSTVKARIVSVLRLPTMPVPIASLAMVSSSGASTTTTTS